MESWLFGEKGLSADEISVEGWHKPGSLTLCSGIWNHAAGSAVMNAGEHPIDGHHRFVWLAVAEGRVTLNRPDDSLALSANDTCMLPAATAEADLRVETDSARVLWLAFEGPLAAMAVRKLGMLLHMPLRQAALPSQMLLAGLFLAACFISMSIGTSVGTIVALTPIAAGVAVETGTSVPMMAAVVVGGSFFGDNLSFISDTTIMATSTQGCKLSDKFRANAFIVLPAALLILVIYLLMGSGVSAPQHVPDFDLAKVIHYLVVLLAAVFGMNVMAVLTLGILLTGVIGIAYGAFDVFGWFEAMGKGIVGMGELIVVTMMAGGLLEIVKQQGGIDFIISQLTSRVHTKKGAELAIAALVSLVNICPANNTVAILAVGGISKQIGDRYGVDSRKAASILDTFSCMMQGLIPYGAQLLMAAGLAQVTPASIIPYLYYPVTIGIAALLAILFRYPKRYS